MKKSTSIICFVLVLLIIFGLAYTAAFGFTVGDYLVPSALDEENGIRRGLDLVGGSVITFEAQVDDSISSDELAQGMDTCVSMLRERLDDLGYLEAQLTQQGDRRIRVEIPSISDPEEAVQKLGATAQLQFIDADGNVVITGADIERAAAAYGKINDYTAEQNYVALTLNSDAVKAFSETTRKYSTADNMAAGKNYISIVLDGVVKSAPSFTEQLNTANLSITVGNDPDECRWLANIISAGALPFSLKDIELRSVGPVLGERALESCITAGGIGLLLVMLFMLIFYRVPGLLADIILVGYVALVALILSIFRINLSLPGIAGVVLSIGMAVDANVVIFERIREELRAGKSIKSSITAGFSRAFAAILDSNITTIIAAVVLYYFGTGTIKGFAITFFIGIVVSMFTAIFVTRLMLKLSVGMGLTNSKAYGV